MTLKKHYVNAIGMLLVAASLWSWPAYAQPRPGFRGPMGGMQGDGGGMMLPMLLRGANLTADQKGQMKQIMANHRATFQDLFNQLRAAQEQMSNKLLSPGAVRDTDLAPQTQQIAQLRNQLADEGLRVVLEIRSILTPDQLAKASQLKAQMQSLHNQMRNLMGPQPGE
ncbi:MAG TPA: Spy/CpxP family protein refolding chaperone [Methylomirabilota bacterium]|nr:Spy/CpxP family protein refolding chaperone [Methylomirabilota bacterium]